MIKVTDLTRDYGENRGVFGLRFQVKPGEPFGLLGPNGAGKTTLIRHLMGFLRPQKGQCTIFGLDCWKDRKQVQRMVGYIPGEMSLMEGMRGEDYLDFLDRYRGFTGEGYRRLLLDRFPVDLNTPIHKMSKGTKQKLGIIAAFSHKPEVLILDEPTSGLDPLMQKEFVDFIGEEGKKGRVILLSSHIFEEVQRTCRRVGILRQGKLLTQDTVREMEEKHSRRYVLQVEKGDAQAFARDFGGTILEDGRVEVKKTADLEEIFLRCYRKGEKE